MNLKILALFLLLSVMSVSVSGCGSKDESSVAASEHTDSESEEQETSENIPDNQDNNQKSEKRKLRILRLMANYLKNTYRKSVRLQKKFLIFSMAAGFLTIMKRN